MSYTTFTYKKLYELFEPVDINCVLLGESTHGTKEFYDIRLNITKHLVKNGGFRCIFLEVEWSIGVELNKYIHSIYKTGAKNLLNGLITKYPIWMTNNKVIEKLLIWLRRWNSIKKSKDEKVFIYGVDCQDIELAKKNLCDDKTIHCKIVKQIVDNYSVMTKNGNNYWNERDKMWNRIIKQMKCGTFILWAHNSHIGDARAYKNKKNLNIGELLRKMLGENMMNIGFTTSGGVVRASNKWGGMGFKKKINKPIGGSYEEDFNEICRKEKISSFIYTCDSSIKEYKMLRYIGVTYDSINEVQAHYKMTNINLEFNYVIHINISTDIQ